MRLLVPLLVLLAVACDRYDLDGEFVGAPCEEQGVRFFAPDADSVEGFVNGPVWVELRCPVVGGALSLTRSDGARADGTVSVHHGARQIRWRPDDRLNHQTQYAVHFESAAGVHDWSYTTNAVGGATNNRPAGAAFAMFPTDGELLDPPGVADLLLPALSDGFFPVIQFLGDPGGPEGGVSVRLGGRTREEAGAPQDVAVATWSPSATWSDPLFEFGPLRLVWPLEAFEFVLENARFGGGVSPDVAWGAGFSVEGWWDTRPADVPLGGAPGLLCLRAAEAGGECTECADGARSCLRLELVLARAPSWDGELVEIDR